MSRSFMIDPTAGTSLPSSQRAYPTGIGFPTIGLDAAVPLNRFLRFEATLQYFINPRPADEQIIGYGNLNDPTGGASATGLTRFTHNDGSTTPYQRQFSYQEALAAKGLVDEALASYEAEIVAAPTDVEAIVRTADLYLTHRKRPERAAELLRRLQRLPAAPPDKVLYATHRLVDLYLGPLDDRGKALVELRRLIDNFPASQAARFAREALAKLKREHHGTDDNA